MKKLKSKQKISRAYHLRMILQTKSLLDNILRQFSSQVKQEVELSEIAKELATKKQETIEIEFPQVEEEPS